MRYIRNSHTPADFIPTSVNVRTTFGVLCFIMAVLCGVLIWFTDAPIAMRLFAGLIYGIVFSAGGAALLITASRSRAAVMKTAPQIAPEVPFEQNEQDPLYTTVCPHCNAVFDYQQSDVCYSRHFPRGYVRCPCCRMPLEHDCEKNAYNPYIPVDVPDDTIGKIHSVEDEDRFFTEE